MTHDNRSAFMWAVERKRPVGLDHRINSDFAEMSCDRSPIYMPEDSLRTDRFQLNVSSRALPTQIPMKYQPAAVATFQSGVLVDAPPVCTGSLWAEAVARSQVQANSVSLKPAETTTAFQTAPPTGRSCLTPLYEYAEAPTPTNFSNVTVLPRTPLAPLAAPLSQEPPAYCPPQPLGPPPSPLDIRSSPFGQHIRSTQPVGVDRESQYHQLVQQCEAQQQQLQTLLQMIRP